MKNLVRIEHCFYKENKKSKKIIVKMNGGSLYDATQNANLTETTGVIYMYNPDIKEHCETSQNKELFLDNKGNVYCRTFDHYNGHFTNFCAGVYDVTFSKMKKCI